MAKFFDLDWFDQQLKKRIQSDRESGAPALLCESVEYSLLAPGKRIRPHLLFASAQLLGVTPEEALPFSLALEMYHCSTLIHDDLPCLDDDDVRRGRASNHKVFGEDVALMAGDALVIQSWTTLLLGAKQTDPSRFVASAARFAKATGAQGVIGGQVLELDLERKGQGKISDIDQIFKMKTGALFDLAIMIPANLAGIEPNDREAYSLLSDFAAAIGHTFQAIDDLEDHAEGQDQGSIKNIVTHQSPKKIKAQSRARLGTSLKALQSHWPDTHAAVTEIAEELLRKLI